MRITSLINHRTTASDTRPHDTRQHGTLPHRLATGLALAAGMLLAVGTAQAERYQAAYGFGDARTAAYDELETPDGGSITVGTVTGLDPLNPQRNVVVTRYDRLGNVVWSNQYDTGFDDYGWTITALQQGGYAIGGWTARPAAGFNEPLENLIFTIDANGNQIWARHYIGTLGADAVHATGLSDAGTSIIQASNGDLVMTAHRRGVPMLIRVRSSDGQVVAIVTYETPAGVPPVAVGFTDLVELPNQDLIVSGSLREFDAAGFPVNTDVLALRARPQLVWVNSARYDNGLTKVGSQFLSEDEGRGIDLTGGPAGIEFLAIGGRTDFGFRAGFGLPSQSAAHILVIDENLNDLFWDAYDPLLGASPTAASTAFWDMGFAAFSYDFARGEYLMGGTSTASNTGLVRHAAMFVTPPGGPARASLEYAPFSEGHAAYFNDRACGYQLAGQVVSSFAPILPIRPAGKYVVNTWDNLSSGCFEARRDLREIDLGPRPQFVPRNDVFRDGDQRFQFQVTPDIRTVILCREDRCTPCRPDFDNNGTLNIFDILAFFAAFGAANPAADINNDGLFNIFDILDFFALFGNGC